MTIEKPINEEIYDAIAMACFEIADQSEKLKALWKQNEELIDKLEGSVPRKLAMDLADITPNIVTHMAHIMFQLGLKLGRTPELMFDLPKGLEAGEKVFRNIIIDAARMKTSNDMHQNEWYLKYEALETLIRQKHPELVSKFFDVVWEGLNTWGEDQFLLGWAVRDNPNALFDLPEPEVF